MIGKPLPYSSESRKGPRTRRSSGSRGWSSLELAPRKDLVVTENVVCAELVRALGVRQAGRVDLNGHGFSNIPRENDVLVMRKPVPRCGF
jgi:hypothetical protein